MAKLRRLHAAADKPRTDGHTFGPNDCRFYCAVHAALPALLDEIERLTAELERTRWVFTELASLKTELTELRVAAAAVRARRTWKHV